MPDVFLLTAICASSPPKTYKVDMQVFNFGRLTSNFHKSISATLNHKVGFTSFFLRFAGSDVLIQCMSTTTHSLSNQTLYWSNVAL